MKPLFLALSALWVHTAFSQHTNIKISHFNAPEEPSIMISTKHPRYLVAGANINSVYTSADSGRTWTIGMLTSSTGVYGDPTITCDTAGNFFYLHLSDPPGTAFLDRIVAQRSTDNGQTWSDGISILGTSTTKDQDKQWPAIDRRNNMLYTSWTEFDNYNSPSPADSSRILFSRSSDGGLTWTIGIRINQKSGDCLDDDNTVEGAVPAVGPNGEVYVAWAGPLGLVFDKSLDGGNTWMANDKVVTSIPGGWSFDIPGIFRANGLPITTCDTSHGPHRGTIYINWCDQRNGANDTDVWLVKSTDGGNTWSTPTRVNNDGPGRQQWYTWMAIDQRNGDLYFVFYDRRNYTDNRTDVWMARSKDGGATFQNFRISETPFAPVSNIFFGDYNNISVEHGVVRPIWTRLENGQLSVWTALVDTAAINIVTAVNGPASGIDEVHAYPNPFNNNSFVAFKLRRAGNVTVEVYDALGRQVAVPIANKHYAAGKYIEKVEARKMGILPGTYFYRVSIDGKLYTRKMILVE